MQTADFHEIHKFSEQSNHWWDERGPFRPLHALNPVRIRFIREVLLAHYGRMAGITMLDIGCGGGLLAEPLCRLGGVVTGLDASEEAIRVARSHAEEQGLPITYQQGTPETFDHSATYQGVMALEIVEHVANLPFFLEKATALVHPQGLFFFSTLNKTVKSLILGKGVAEYILRLVPVGTHEWKKFVRPSSLDRLLRSHGFEIKKLQGVTYCPLRKEWILTDDLSVNYMGVAQAL